MPVEPHWTIYLGPVAQVCTALIAAFVAIKFGLTQAKIARQQAATAALAAETARNKLKFDLFDRRIKMYDLVRTFLQLGFRNDEIDIVEMAVFGEAVHPLKWLTDDELYRFASVDIFRLIMDADQLTKKLSRTERGDPEWDAVANEKVDLYRRVAQAGNELADRFDPYLKLSH